MKKIIIVSLFLISSFVITACSSDNSPKENTKLVGENGGVFTDSVAEITPNPSIEDEVETERKILFFHATWCPICRAIEEDIQKNPDRIPQDVMIIKVDFDSEKELKEKYDVKYQYTFVEIDSNGEEINQWSAISFNDLINKITQ